jgi:hypothetical protein
MSVKNRKRAQSGEPKAIELIEESVHLLRKAPVSTHLVYFLGAGSWVLGFLFFWAHTTWFAPSGARLAWSALGMVGLFIVLKVAQAEFCARLLAQRLGESPPVWSWRRAADLAAAQLSVQAWGVFAIPVAALITLPFGWVYGFYQQATVIGQGREMVAEAKALTRRWPMQNHVGLLLLSLVGFTVWINVGSSFYFVPWLANRMLGLDNVLGLTGWTFFNTTFFASIGALTWLAVDPLVKAFYVLRVFHGRAQLSGEDLRVELRLARPRTAGVRGVAVSTSLAVLVAVLWAMTPQSSWAATALVEQPAVEKKASVDSASLDQALDEVLKRRDFQWQLRPQPPDPVLAKEDGPITKFFREGMETIDEMIDSLKRGWERLQDWVDEIFGSDKKEKRSPVNARGSGAGLGTLRVFLYILIGALVLAIIVVVVIMVRSARRNTAPALVGRAITLAQPDLRDEATHAAQMPADGWLALAKEQMAKGEWRLALRALYLATLARHAADGLLTLAKFKTNLDYERELRRRAVLQPEVPVQFATHRLDFETVWYGRTPASETIVRAWLDKLEGAVLSR